MTLGFVKHKYEQIEKPALYQAIKLRERVKEIFFVKLSLIVRIMEQLAYHLPWLTSFLEAKFYNLCKSHNKYCSFFCINCLESTICVKCLRKTNKHEVHDVLQVYRASGETSIKISDFKKFTKSHLDISDIQRYTINSSPIVYINQRHENEQNCKTEAKYCSIECKIKSGTEEPGVYVQPPNSFRKRSRKGIPIRSPLF